MHIYCISYDPNEGEKDAHYKNVHVVVSKSPNEGGIAQAILAAPEAGPQHHLDAVGYNGPVSNVSDWLPASKQ